MTEVDNVLVRAKELSEIWTGTTAGKIIDAGVSNLETSMQSSENLAAASAIRLAVMCDEIENSEGNGE